MLKRKVRGLIFGLRLLVSELFLLPFHLPRPLSDPGSYWVLKQPVQLLLLHRFFGEVGGGHKLQQQLQAIAEIFRAGEVVSGQVIAGEGIGDRAQCGEFRGHIPIRHIEELVL